MKAKKPNYPQQTIMVNDACNYAKTNNFWTKKYFTTDFYHRYEMDSYKSV